jgi:dolichyl-phosphate beta-glucosyltransferase
MSESGGAGARPDSAAPPGVALSLVIPAFNEGQRLDDGVARLVAAIAAGAIDPETTEFIVVDDGSTDDTTERAGALFSAFPHVRLLRLPQNHGKGGAVRAGVAVATAPVIAFADADMAIDPGQTPQFVGALAKADLAIGSRSASGASVDRSSLHRSLMNRAFNRVVNVLTSVDLDDTQCGFKAFRAPVAKLLFHCSVTERFAFDVEILSLARRFGLVIAEVPVQWLRVEGSQIRPLSDARSMVSDVFRASRGAAKVAPVPTLCVKLPGELPGAAPGASAAALAAFLPPGLPVLGRSDGATLVLCPLMDEPEVEATAAQIVARCPGAAVETTALTVAQVAQVARLSPLCLSGDDDTAAPESVARPAG